MTRRAWMAMLIAMAMAGCAGPTVTVRHILPADLPVMLAGKKITTQAEVAEGPQQYAADADRLLREALADMVGAGEAVTVKATVFIDSEDIQSTRTIRQRDESGQMQSVEVPSLIRTADVRVDYVITGAIGKRLAAAETQGHYTSLADPRARGELGLARADDPANVPELDAVIPSLLNESAEAFARMIAQPVVTAEMQMQPAAGPLARQAEQAVRQGRYSEAAELLRQAADQRPEHFDTRFNLAVTEELAGQLGAALADYRRAKELNPSASPTLDEAITRANRISARMNPGN